MAFNGFSTAAFEFYERLALDNSRTFWQANKATYETAVKQPMVALLDELAEYGPFHVFRPYKDVRFSKDKTPYKDHIGAFGESEGGAGFYVHLGASGMFCGAGYYSMAADQLQRFREAVAADATGTDLAARCAAVEKKGYHTGAIGELKTAPRGYPKDHPRIVLLRRKGLFVGREWPLAKWMHTKAVVDRVRTAWTDAAEVNEWLDTHVGPSTLPPDDLAR